MSYGHVHNAHLGRQRRLAIEPLEDRRLLSLGNLTDYPTLPSDPGLSLPGSSLASSIRAGTDSMYAAVLEQVGDALDAGPLQASQRSPNLADLPYVNSRSARVDLDGEIQTYIHVSQVNDALLASIEGLGISVDTSNAEMGVVQAWVSPGRVEEVLNLPGVERLGMPDYAVYNTGSVTSAGDGILRADQVRSRFAGFGIDGSGIKIGVISDGVDHWKDVRDFDDLPNTLKIDPARRGSGDEGTAMLEIVHDLAPGAQLFFSGPETSLEMAGSILYMLGKDVDVIVDDLGFFGEPYFEDGPVAQAAQSAVNADITYITSAGNRAEDHYQVPYLLGEAAPRA